MLYPTDAFELIKADPRISGGAVPSAADGGKFYPGIKMEYDVPEVNWTKLAMPAIVWVPMSDKFDTNHPEKIELDYEGRKVTLEPVWRCLAGHEVHLFVARTADLQCYRDMYKLLSRFMVAMRYALQTTANYRTDGGRWLSSPMERAKMPNALHYVLSVVPYVSMVEEPNPTVTGLSSVIAVRSVSSDGTDD